MNPAEPQNNSSSQSRYETDPRTWVKNVSLIYNEEYYKNTVFKSPETLIL